MTTQLTGRMAATIHNRRTDAPGRRWLCAIMLCFILCLPAPLISAPGETTAEIGFRIFTHYSDRDYRAGTQNFRIVQDHRGLIYVGNLFGVVEFDGTWWRLIQLDNETAAMSVGRTPGGTIAAGGIAEFGLLEQDDSGALVYRSLVPKVPEANRSFGEVWAIINDGTFTYFLTNHHLFKWDGTAITTLTDFPDNLDMHTGFQLGNTCYIWTNAGLSRIENDRLIPIDDGRFADRRILSMMETGTDALALIIQDEGLFLWNKTELTALAPRLIPWAQTNQLSGGTRLSDGRYLLHSLRAGGLILNADGSISERINAALGLADDRINHAMIASDGALWLALNSGISRVDVSSPISVFDDRSGLTGSVYTLTRHLGSIFVGTSFGIFKLGDSGSRHTVGDNTISLRLRPVPGLEVGGWDLESVDDSLLVGTSSGIYTYSETRGTSRVPGTRSVTAYILTRSNLNPDRFYVGTRRGLGLLSRKSGKWTFDGVVPQSPAQVRSIVENADGTVWVGTTHSGITAMRLDPENPTGHAPLEIIRMGEGEQDVHLVDGRIRVTGHNLIQEPQPDGTLAPASAFGDFRTDDLVYILTTDAANRVWMNTQPPSIAIPQPDGSYAVDNSALRGMIEGVVPMIYPEPDGIVWLATDRAVYRYDSRISWISTGISAPLIRKITAWDTDYLPPDFDGVSRIRPKIPQGFDRIRFEYSALSFQSGVQFQFRLHPETEWSNWSETPFTEFTDLWEGNYTFQVRSRYLDTVSPITSYDFRVRPPWFRSHPAILIYVLMIIGSVVAIVRLRNAQLETKARQLQKLVDQQTAQLADTITQLEQANKRLHSLSFMDSLTGVANRRKMEETLLQEWNRAYRRSSAIGLIMLDIDWFKQLNDRYGHAVGDDCLKRIGAYLQQRVRRSGDLAARFGGEEFAIIMPDTEMDGLRHMAEDLRSEIEAMQIENEGSPFGVITASFGLAIAYPAREKMEPDDLVKAADESMYKAKRSGKNCIHPQP